MPTMHTLSPRNGESARSLPVARVVELVRLWVDAHARNLPGFAGAYLWGGITALPPTAPFQLFRDVDVVVVLAGDLPADNLEVFFHGLILEVIWQPLADHHDVAAVLADPSRGPNLASTTILADPHGILAPLQQAVVAEHDRQPWVAARCAVEKDLAQTGLAALRQATTLLDRLDAARSLLSGLSGLLAIATGARPTTRRTLTLLHDLLVAHGRPDLHELALRVMGSAYMDHAQAQALLNQSAAAFDRAVEVYRTPIPFGFALQPHLRPYHCDGAQELINEGRHREAMFWIVCMDTAYIALLNDAPPAERSTYASQLQVLGDALGYTADAAWAERVAIAERLTCELFAVADEIVARLPA